MDDLKIEKFYCTRLLDISLAKITLNIANNRGQGINHTFNLINELHEYVLYLYNYIYRLERDKTYLLKKSLKEKEKMQKEINELKEKIKELENG
jgi:hypothetical protein